MARISFICSSSVKLNEIPFQAGQIIFVQDERAIYVDGTERTSYQQIITLAKEELRQALVVPLKGFYFIEDTKILWRYNGAKWIKVTDTPDRQMVFDDYENFPNPGDINTVYVDGIKMYRYEDGAYKLMNRDGSVWIEI